MPFPFHPSILSFSPPLLQFPFFSSPFSLFFLASLLPFPPPFPPSCQNFPQNFPRVSDSSTPSYASVHAAHIGHGIRISSFLSHKVRAKSKIVPLCLGVVFLVFHFFSCYYTFSLLYASWRPAFTIAYTGSPYLYFFHRRCMKPFCGKSQYPSQSPLSCWITFTSCDLWKRL